MLGDLCQTCGIGYIMPGGRCDHCNVPTAMSEIAKLLSELSSLRAENERLKARIVLLSSLLDHTPHSIRIYNEPGIADVCYDDCPCCAWMIERGKK